MNFFISSDASGEDSRIRARDAGITTGKLAGYLQVREPGNIASIIEEAVDNCLGWELYRHG